MSRLHLKTAQLKHWAKTSPTPSARMIRGLWQQLKALELPTLPLLHKGIYLAHRVLSTSLQSLSRRLYWTPAFKSQIKGGQQLYLYSGMPQVIRPLQIQLGRNCRVSGVSTFSGRWCSTETPQLIVGDNVDIGWQTTIAVGTQVVLGDNVRMAGRAFLAGYPGHPLNPEARAAGEPDADDQVGAIELQANVWLGTGVTVLAGVTIGENTIVGAGSVVTKSLPANVIAAGNPARVVRHLMPEDLPADLKAEVAPGVCLSRHHGKDNARDAARITH